MSIRRRELSDREAVFAESLRRHGFREVDERTDEHPNDRLYSRATLREDTEGVDFWIRMPHTSIWVPVQITQRGIKQWRYFKGPPVPASFVRFRSERIAEKRYWCEKARILLIVVRDHIGSTVPEEIHRTDASLVRRKIARYIKEPVMP